MSLAPRASALAILTEIEKDGITLDRRMDRFHLESRFDRRDEAFVNALVYGVLRWRRLLDWIIGKVSTTPFARIDPDVVTILRLGLYQMMFMDRVPNSAAVNTSVELAKTRPKKWLSGFVNAVLRNALRGLPEIAHPPAGDNSVQTLSIVHSMPEWMISRWIDQFGFEEAVGLCNACNRIPPLTLRTNTLKVDRAALMEALQDHAENLRATPYSPEGVSLDGLIVPLFKSPAFENGWFQVQDEAAQAVGHLLAPRPGQTVLDACAGLGGKTAHMAAVMKNTGRILAADHDANKLEKLEMEMQRLGITMVTSQKADLRRSGLRDKGMGPFDRILLDAPCSGMGVIRRNPDTKWVRTLRDIDRFASGQVALLKNLSAALKPGGILVYAVCSTEPEETQAVIKSFLNEQPDFAIDDKLSDLPSTLRPLISAGGCLLTTPHRHGMDGFFAVRLRRRVSDSRVQV